MADDYCVTANLEDTRKGLKLEILILESVIAEKKRGLREVEKLLGRKR